LRPEPFFSPPGVMGEAIPTDSDHSASKGRALIFHRAEGGEKKKEKKAREKQGGTFRQGLVVVGEGGNGSSPKGLGGKGKKEKTKIKPDKKGSPRRGPLAKSIGRGH